MTGAARCFIMRVAMTPRQRRFVQEYLIDLNASAAARRAGYAGGASADVQASRLLRNVKIRAAVDAAMAARAERTKITADRVLAELAKIGFANMQDYVKVTAAGDPLIDFSDLNRDQFAAIGEVTVEDFTEGRGDDARDVRRIRMKLNDKRAALVDLGRHLALFTDNVKHGGEITHKDAVDRPPRETYEDWAARRQRELTALHTIPAAGSAE